VSDERPALRVVRGTPSPEELAVVTALVAAAGSGSDEPSDTPRRGGWSDPAAKHRRALLPGPGGWRSSAW
jgi:Acyl-CoA carboxylase epsilon subunit